MLKNWRNRHTRHYPNTFSYMNKVKNIFNSKQLKQIGKKNKNMFMRSRVQLIHFKEELKETKGKNIAYMLLKKKRNIQLPVINGDKVYSDLYQLQNTLQKVPLYVNIINSDVNDTSAQLINNLNMNNFYIKLNTLKEFKDIKNVVYVDESNVWYNNLLQKQYMKIKNKSFLKDKEFYKGRISRKINGYYWYGSFKTLTKKMHNIDLSLFDKDIEPKQAYIQIDAFREAMGIAKEIEDSMGKDDVDEYINSLENQKIMYWEDNIKALLEVDKNNKVLKNAILQKIIPIDVIDAIKPIPIKAENTILQYIKNIFLIKNMNNKNMFIERSNILLNMWKWNYFDNMEWMYDSSKVILMKSVKLNAWLDRWYEKNSPDTDDNVDVEIEDWTETPGGLVFGWEYYKTKMSKQDKITIWDPKKRNAIGYLKDSVSYFNGESVKMYESSKWNEKYSEKYSHSPHRPQPEKPKKYFDIYWSKENMQIWNKYRNAFKDPGVFSEGWILNPGQKNFYTYDVKKNYFIYYNYKNKDKIVINLKNKIKINVLSVRPLKATLNINVEPTNFGNKPKSYTFSDIESFKKKAKAELPLNYVFNFNYKLTPFQLIGYLKHITCYKMYQKEWYQWVTGAAVNEESIVLDKDYLLKKKNRTIFYNKNIKKRINYNNILNSKLNIKNASDKMYYYKIFNILNIFFSTTKFKEIDYTNNLTFHIETFNEILENQYKKSNWSALTNLLLKKLEKNHESKSVLEALNKKKEFELQEKLRLEEIKKNTTYYRSYTVRLASKLRSIIFSIIKKISKRTEAAEEVIFKVNYNKKYTVYWLSQLYQEIKQLNWLFQYTDYDQFQKKFKLKATNNVLKKFYIEKLQLKINENNTQTQKALYKSAVLKKAKQQLCFFRFFDYELEEDNAIKEANKRINEQRALLNKKLYNKIKNIKNIKMNKKLVFAKECGKLNTEIKKSKIHYQMYLKNQLREFKKMVHDSWERVWQAQSNSSVRFRLIMREAKADIEYLQQQNLWNWVRYHIREELDSPDWYSEAIDSEIPGLGSEYRLFLVDYAYEKYLRELAVTMALDVKPPMKHYKLNYEKWNVKGNWKKRIENPLRSNTQRWVFRWMANYYQKYELPIKKLELAHEKNKLQLLIEKANKRDDWIYVGGCGDTWRFSAELPILEKLGYVKVTGTIIDSEGEEDQVLDFIDESEMDAYLNFGGCKDEEDREIVKKDFRGFILYKNYQMKKHGLSYEDFPEWKPLTTAEFQEEIADIDREFDEDAKLLEWKYLKHKSGLYQRAIDNMEYVIETAKEIFEEDMEFYLDYLYEEHYWWFKYEWIEKQKEFMEKVPEIIANLPKNIEESEEYKALVKEWNKKLRALTKERDRLYLNAGVKTNSEKELYDKKVEVQIQSWNRKKYENWDKYNKERYNREQSERYNREQRAWNQTTLDIDIENDQITVREKGYKTVYNTKEFLKKTEKEWKEKLKMEKEVEGSKNSINIVDLEKYLKKKSEKSTIFKQKKMYKTKVKSNYKKK